MHWLNLLMGLSASINGLINGINSKVFVSKRMLLLTLLKTEGISDAAWTGEAKNMHKHNINIGVNFFMWISFLREVI